MPELPETGSLANKDLVTLSSGNARIVRVGARLDGRAASFGRAFWKLLGDEAPSTIAALRKHGVREATYVDRYLLTPLALRLLFEVIRKMPGSEEASLNILTARVSRAERQGWAVFHTFVEDAKRRIVLKNLLPDAEIDIRDKSALPHERSLELCLNDDRNMTILLDQGFGAWRADGAPRHDFAAEPDRQARSLQSLDFTVGVREGSEVPIVLEDVRTVDS